MESWLGAQSVKIGAGARHIEIFVIHCNRPSQPIQRQIKLALQSIGTGGAINRGGIVRVGGDDLVVVVGLGQVWIEDDGLVEVGQGGRVVFQIAVSYAAAIVGFSVVRIEGNGLGVIGQGGGVVF